MRRVLSAGVLKLVSVEPDGRNEEVAPFIAKVDGHKLFGA